VKYKENKGKKQKEQVGKKKKKTIIKTLYISLVVRANS
jgi:hypothetical protein